MAPSLSLHLLDLLELRDADLGSGVRLPIGKAAELLALLAFRAGEIPRSEAAALLWPETPEPVARHRLRTLLLEITRRHEGLLLVSRDRVGLGEGVVAHFEGLGVFAPGLEGEWLEEARADLGYREASRLVVAAQEQVAENPLAAIEFAERALRIVPESLAAGALLTRLRAAPRSSEPESAPFLSVRDRARIAIARAPVRQATGRFQGPIEEIDGLLANLPIDPPLRSALLLSRAGYIYEQGDYARCRRDALAAISAGRGDRLNSAETAAAHFCLGKVAYSSSDFSEALIQGRNAARLAESCGETNLVVLAECLLGACEILRGRPERVEEHLRRARTFAGKDSYLRARSENVAGWAALGSGATVRAIRAFESARIGSESDLRLAANVLQGLARAHEMMGDRAQARRWLGEGMNLLEGTELDLPVVGLLTGLADLDEAEGRYEEALELHRQGLARRAGAGDRLGSFTSLAGIGRMSLRLGRTEEAVRHLREAYALYVALLGDLRLPVAALPLAEALLASGRQREAAALVARSIEILESEPPEVRAGSTYPAEISALAKRLSALLMT